MSTDTAAPTTEQVETVVATQARSLFTYSAWIHVGPGAEDCEAIDQAAGTNDCSDPLHFHAWCRLPNQFQHRDVREKALAAKARKTRQLRDPQSDAATILDEEMDRLAAGGEEVRKDIVGELMEKDWWRDWVEAQQDVREMEEGPDDEKPFEHIDDDQKRYLALEKLDAEERPTDEFDSLARHIERYNELVDKAVQERQTPRREALEALDSNEIVDRVRTERVNAAAMDEFMHVYSTHEWFVCTLTHPGGPQRFASLEAMAQQTAPEVIEALKLAYSDLERLQNTGGELGNS